MKKIIVLCPANTVSGGPLLLHQMCYELRLIGYNAFMYYCTSTNNVQQNLVAEEYKKFKNPCVEDLEDIVGNIFVIPEIYPFLLKICQKAQCIFWWLSVDAYYGVMVENVLEKTNNVFTSTTLKEGLMFSRPLYKESIVHFVQSQYAFEHCRQIGIQEDRIQYLSDYLDPVFIKNAILKRNEKKENIILFNPAKGYEFTKLLMEFAPQFIWIPLVHLSAEKMAEVLKKAKVYIDFGDHPGKDRIPREAAISGCCVITGKKGSADNSVDIPIPDSYKFPNDKTQLSAITNKIKEIFASYEECNQDFLQYRKIIFEEEKLFKMQMKKLFADIVGEAPLKKDRNTTNPILKLAYKKLQSKS